MGGRRGVGEGKNSQGYGRASLRRPGRKQSSATVSVEGAAGARWGERNAGEEGCGDPPRRPPPHLSPGTVGGVWWGEGAGGVTTTRPCKTATTAPGGGGLRGSGLERGCGGAVTGVETSVRGGRSACRRRLPAAAAEVGWRHSWLVA